jgi:hypothetical protein
VDDVRKDIQNLKEPNWKTLAQDRRRSKELVEKAKTLHKELYSHIRRLCSLGCQCYIVGGCSDVSVECPASFFRVTGFGSN